MDTYIPEVESLSRRICVENNLATKIDFSRFSEHDVVHTIIIGKCKNLKKVDLTSFNGNPNLTVIKIRHNMSLRRLKLPKNCKNLEAVILDNNGLWEGKFMSYSADPPDDLIGCPRLRLFDVSYNDALGSVRLPFLFQEFISGHPPIIGIIQYDWETFSPRVFEPKYEPIPEEVKEYFVIEFKGEKFEEYKRLRQEYRVTPYPDRWEY